MNSARDEVHSALRCVGDIPIESLQLALEWRRRVGIPVIDTLTASGAEQSEGASQRHDGLVGPVSIPQTRHYQRAEIPADWRVTIGPVAHEDLAHLNISLGGLGVDLPGRWAPGDRLLVRIDVGHEETLELVAHVVHVHKRGDRERLGAVFVELSPDDALRLDALMSSLATAVA